MSVKNRIILGFAGYIVLLALIVIVCLSFQKNDNDNFAWAKAKRINSISSYNQYLTLNPKGVFASFASNRIGLILSYDEISWHQAKVIDALPVYDLFIKNHPHSLYVDSANAYILKDSCHFKSVKKQV